jgi:hypothetical protein
VPSLTIGNQIFQSLACLPTAPSCHSTKRGLRYVAAFWAVLGQTSQLAYAYNTAQRVEPQWRIVPESK